ncbi:MAG: DUF11 domain-containing protein, partial [Polyangiaceae bacterium]|nr:DUF11 domain-containing protein [Polyangiaceae bacterium]
MSPRASLFLVLACAALSPLTASAQQLRYSATVPGGVVGTGNTLGLSKASGSNGPGTADSIGTFLSLDANSIDDNPANPANPWPMGTTYDWTKNGSSAVLTLPEAEVLYAELLWGGSYLYGGEDVSGSLGTSVTLSAGGMSIQVSPDAATAMTIAETAASGFPVNYYMRSADVTAFVQQAGEGTYEVSGVPATQTSSINSLNAAGWTLVVAYRDEGVPMRNLSIFVGGSFVDEDTQQDYMVSGFCAPPAGEVEGTVVVSAIEGDTNYVGDKLQIGPGAAGPFVDLAGPNNPADNFFCSQINDSTGKLDTQGTFGMVNHDAFAGMNASGARQGWDVTTVPLSSNDNQLQNGQTSAVIRTVTTGDSYAPILAAFAIDVNAPDFKGGAATSVQAPAEAAIGDTFTVTATLENTGEVTAQDIKLTLPIDAALSLVAFSTDGKPGDINGNTVDVAALSSGVDLGDLNAGAKREVALDVKVDDAPMLAGFYFKAKWAYGFEVCPNEPLVPESFSKSTLVAFNSSGSSSSTGTGTGTGTGT